MNIQMDMDVRDMKDMVEPDQSEEMTPPDMTPDSSPDMQDMSDMPDPPDDMGADMPMSCDTMDPTTVGQLSAEGVCEVTGCADGFGDGNNDLSDGCECSVEQDPLDGKDDNCDGYDFDASQVIFVSTTGDDTNDGQTASAAVATWSKALTLLTPARKTLVVQQGNYKEIVSINGGVTIYGGYDEQWTRQDMRRSVLEPPIGRGDAAPPTLSVSYGGEPVLLDGVRIKGPNLAQRPGQTAVTLRAERFPVDTFTLNNVLIEGGDGGHGKKGADGGVGASGQDGTAGSNQLAGRGGQSTCGAAGGNGGAPRACGVNNYGEAGRDGFFDNMDNMSNIRGGAGGAGGENRCMNPIIGCGGALSDGQAGKAGAPGAAGTPGKSHDTPQAGQFGADGVWIAPQPVEQSTAGESGTGGGGGGAGGLGIDSTTAGYGGGGGSGGCGGEPGDAGQPGGASVAILLVESHIKFGSTSIVVLGKSGNGGQGGNAGSGGQGGKGLLGGPTTGGCSTLSTQGGQGGEGGRGGQGAPGVGGCAGSIFGIVPIGNANVDASPMYVPKPNGLGEPGQGGRNDAQLTGCKGVVMELWRQ